MPLAFVNTAAARTKFFCPKPLLGAGGGRGAGVDSGGVAPGGVAEEPSSSTLARIGAVVAATMILGGDGGSGGGRGATEIILKSGVEGVKTRESG